jgi:hypothetical protein
LKASSVVPTSVFLHHVVVVVVVAAAAVNVRYSARSLRCHQTIHILKYLSEMKMDFIEKVLSVFSRSFVVQLIWKIF